MMREVEQLAYLEQLGRAHADELRVLSEYRRLLDKILVLPGFEFTATPPFVANPELLQATSALPYQLFALITAGVGLGENVADPQGFRWATALVLLVVVLSFYAVGIGARYYFRRKLQHQ